MSDPDFGRLTPGGKIVALLLTALVMALLGWFLKWVGHNYGNGWLAITVLVEASILFPIAFWLEARDRQRSRQTQEDQPGQRF